MGKIQLPQGLEEFLAEAKRACYAKKVIQPINLIGGRTEYYFGDFQLLYRDSYVGDNPFQGNEIVSVRGASIWAMGYRGQAENQDSQEVFDVLREALAQVDAKNPIRGPERVEVGDWRYSVWKEGNLAEFRGREFITKKEASKKERVVYVGDFFGGRI